ncbi:hypothetical protein Dalk_3552 [Desulfatibacillum aliphaticivorans]|uniref:Uncharacterized protein n=1 Tax=Desulfatibacillum aliphaticivorans TaxID=218208 RepID=B8FC35_DESAL|nr:hypothetical protein [Desulfatibacillum aliphaticivorans]ACL05240.1 hypothetical protein Dalk_3552 [Desulfatibacillum aliphaticivorans]
MPGVQNVHVDGVLSNIAVEYRNGKMIAGEVFPDVEVGKKSDKYFVYDKADRFTPAQTARGPKDEANEVEWNVSPADYACNDEALKEFVPDSVVANADVPLRPRAKTVEVLTDLIMLGREIRVKDLATAPANFGTGFKITLSGTDQFSDFDNSDPIAVIDAGKAACFMAPNTMIISKPGFDVLKRHPQLLDHVKGGATNSNPAKVSIDVMKEIFEVDNIVIGAAKYNTANKGKTASFDYIWPKSIVLAYIDPKPELEGVSWSKAFRWKQMATNQGYKVRTWRDESRGGGGEVIEVETSLVEKVVCSDLAYLISGAFG